MLLRVDSVFEVELAVEDRFLDSLDLFFSFRVEGVESGS